MNKKAPAAGARLSRREQLRQERRRRTLLWNIILLGGGALAILAIIGYMVLNLRPGPLPGEVVIPDEGAGHVDEGAPLTFNHYPPSSGTHYPVAAEWGFYNTPVSEGVFVHNLEHGGVAFLYYCDTACPELEAQFQDLYTSAPPAPTFDTKKVLVTPYDKSKMPSPIVGLAWGHQVNFERFDKELMLRWYKRFVNRGPEGTTAR